MILDMMNSIKVGFDQFTVQMLLFLRMLTVRRSSILEGDESTLYGTNIALLTASDCALLTASDCAVGSVQERDAHN